MTETFDYVVVGSGAAGATAARVLADTGTSIAVVEEGPAVGVTDFEDAALPSFQRLYRGQGAQRTSGRAPMLVLQGRCVGGTTVVNSAILRRLPEAVWQEWSRVHRLGGELQFAEIDAAADRVESELHAAATPEAVWGGNGRLLARAAAAAGLEGRAIRRNVRACRGSARCNFGCPHGAKQSMELTYLPYARARGAAVLADQRAVEVTWSGSRATGVRTDRDRFEARRAVIVAASAVETPRLLARSGVRSPHLGRHFQGHPGVALVGLFDHPVGIGEGATQGFEVDGLQDDAHVKVETLAVSPETFIGGLPGVGRGWVELMAEFGRAAVWVLPLRARGEGEVGRTIRFRLDPGDLPNLRRGLRRAAGLMVAAGAREVVCPIDGLPSRLGPDDLDRIEHATLDPAAYPLAMSHLFGTARMSPRPEDGVVGPDFLVHGTQNLYVVDSSVFPTNLGVNPQLSVMALARIAAERLAS